MTPIENSFNASNYSLKVEDVMSRIHYWTRFSGSVAYMSEFDSYEVCPQRTQLYRTICEKFHKL